MMSTAWGCWMLASTLSVAVACDERDTLGSWNMHSVVQELKLHRHTHGGVAQRDDDDDKEAEPQSIGVPTTVCGRPDPVDPIVGVLIKANLVYSQSSSRTYVRALRKM
jgi:hypothetical protein